MKVSYILVVVHLLLLKVAKTNLQLGRGGGWGGGGCWRSSQVPKSYNGDLKSCFS